MSSTPQPLCYEPIAAPLILFRKPKIHITSSNNQLWTANSLQDGNMASCYSSYPTDAGNSQGFYVAAWTPGQVSVGEVTLGSRMDFNYSSIHFPVGYHIYLTSPDGNQWIHAGHYTNQPDESGYARVKLNSTYSTYGILVVPTSIASYQGSTYFQLCDLNLN